MKNITETEWICSWLKSVAAVAFILKVVGYLKSSCV